VREETQGVGAKKAMAIKKAEAEAKAEE